jgi:hypothetical protein
VPAGVAATALSIFLEIAPQLAATWRQAQKAASRRFGARRPPRFRKAQDRDMIEATAPAIVGPRPRLLLLVLAAALSGCAHQQSAPPNWQTIISHKDVDRMRDWRKTWVDALATARADGHGAAVTAEGALLDPDAGLDRPMPPAGDYRCRVVAFGKGSGTIGGFTASPAAKCRLNGLGGGILGYATLDGTQRPIGRIYPASGAQLTFLGTLSLGDESRPFDYGVDAGRDLVGLVERIGAGRWRLALPHPPFGGAFQVIELTPSSG